MILKSSVCLLLLLCASLPELCSAAEDASLGEHFLTTVGLHRVADMIATDSEHLSSAIHGLLKVKSAKEQLTKDGRGVERRELEIALQGSSKAAAAADKATLTYLGVEHDPQGLSPGNITLFDRLQHHRWHDVPGEVMILNKKIPARVGEDFSSKVLKLPAGTLQWVAAALERRHQHAEWFSQAVDEEAATRAITAELKGANPLWTLVLRMWLTSHKHEQFAHDWAPEGGTQVADYEAALVLHMLSCHEKPQPHFEALIEKSQHQAVTAGGLALGALCACVSCEQGLMCWYQCEFVHPKTGMSWEDWNELAPAIQMCPPYGLACRLSLAHRQKTHAPGNELMHRVLAAMSLVEKE